MDRNRDYVIDKTTINSQTQINITRIEEHQCGNPGLSEDLLKYCKQFFIENGDRFENLDTGFIIDQIFLMVQHEYKDLIEKGWFEFSSLLSISIKLTLWSDSRPSTFSKI